MSVRALGHAVTALLLSAAVPSVSVADSSAAMDACMKAFVSSSAVQEQKVTLGRSAEWVPRPFAASGLYKIDLIATDRDSGKQVASIVCHAEPAGTIVAMNGHLTAPVALSR